MQFIEFKNQLSAYPVFSLQDVLKSIPDFYRIQLDRWEKKGYLQKLKRGFYCLADYKKDQDFLFYVANKIYVPSYISLEMALKYYGFIPEEIFQITSVSTRKTINFKTTIGNFKYQHIKPGLFWGYQLIDYGRHKLLLADPEKALLDYLYLHPNIKTSGDFKELRINRDEFLAGIDLDKLHQYLAIFGSKQLVIRTKIFLTTISHDHT